MHHSRHGERRGSARVYTISGTDAKTDDSGQKRAVRYFQLRVAVSIAHGYNIADASERIRTSAIAGIVACIAVEAKIGCTVPYAAHREGS